MCQPGLWHIYTLPPWRLLMLLITLLKAFSIRHYKKWCFLKEPAEDKHPWGSNSRSIWQNHPGKLNLIINAKVTGRWKNSHLAWSDWNIYRAEKLSSTMHNREPEGLVLFSPDTWLIALSAVMCKAESSCFNIFIHAMEKKPQNKQKIQKIKSCHMTKGSKGSSSTVYLTQLCMSKTVSTSFSPRGLLRTALCCQHQSHDYTDESWSLFSRCAKSLLLGH